MNERKPTIITWDWKEQPDWAAVRFAIIEQWDATIYEVETGCDEYAIVIAPQELGQEGAQYAYDHRYDEEPTP